MIVQPTFHIPPAIEAGLLSGDLQRFGGVVRDPAGRLVTHLKEIPAPRADDQALSAAASLLRKPVVIVGIATLAVVGTAAAAATIVGKRRRVLPKCVEKYNDSLRAYIEAVGNQRVDAELIDRLIADLDAVKAYADNGKITLDFSMEQAETLVQLVIDYTRHLAEANSIDHDESTEMISTQPDLSADLRRYLEVQRSIFNSAA